VLCQITSNPYGDPSAIALNATDFTSGGLMVASFARPGKLFTASSGLIVKSVGLLSPDTVRTVLLAVAALFQPPTSP
jgi:mRNA interferase MazF